MPLGRHVTQAKERMVAIATESTEQLLIDVKEVARILDLSTPTIYRLSDRGAMPRPLKIGGRNRWDRSALQTWISEGCKPIRSTGNRGR